MLIFLITSPLLGAALILWFWTSEDYCKLLGALVSSAVFVASLGLWVLFDDLNPCYQFVVTLTWFKDANISVDLGVDGLSLFLILLTTFLTPLCLVCSYASLKWGSQLFTVFFLTMESVLILAFSVLDLLTFYVFFESILIPMFFLLVYWGSRSRRVRAAYYLFYYTLFGSLLMLVGILYVHSQLGSTNVLLLLEHGFSTQEQQILWCLFFIAFAIKVPVVPFHVWLPEAHVEAPTAGSVILAGILLKLGGYGLLRFVIPVLPEATAYYTPLVFLVGSISIIYSSLTTLRQVDLKKIIAYSSVAHMNLGLLGLFAGNALAIEGSVMLMIGHGLVSSALFLLVGVLYDRHHTRSIRYYGGLTQVMPLFSLFFLFFSLANMGLPGTSNFIGEILVFIGLLNASSIVTLIVGWGMVFCAGYSLWLYNRINSGSLRLTNLGFFSDMTSLEVGVCGIMAILSLILGVYPKPVLDGIHLMTLVVLNS